MAAAELLDRQLRRNDFLVGLIEQHGAAAVNAACEQAHGFPAHLVCNFKEVMGIVEALGETDGD